MQTLNDTVPITSKLILKKMKSLRYFAVQNNDDTKDIFIHWGDGNALITDVVVKPGEFYDLETQKEMEAEMKMIAVGGTVSVSIIIGIGN